MEIMLAVTFFAVAFVSLLDMYNRGVFADIYLDRAATAVNLAQERVEELKAGSYASVATGTVTENPVAGFTNFRRTTAVTLTAANPNSTGKTITVTVSWLMKQNWESFALSTFLADF